MNQSWNATHSLERWQSRASADNCCLQVTALPALAFEMHLNEFRLTLLTQSATSKNGLKRKDVKLE